MQNYVEKLLELDPIQPIYTPNSAPLQLLTAYKATGDAKVLEAMLRALAQRLPYFLGQWPSFSDYEDDWYLVQATFLHFDVVYCERGGLDKRKTGLNFVEVTYEIFKIAQPIYSREAETLAAALERINDQRLLIWLRMASQIKHMFEVNHHFGWRSFYANVMWMCEELVRMGVCNTAAEGFEQREVIIHALKIGGLPEEVAQSMYEQASA